jgi:predicted  nucleic acid-binding Zn-ribbon protein
MNLKTLKAIIDNYSHLQAKDNPSDTKKKATMRAFYHSGKALINMLSTAKQDSEDFAQKVKDAQYSIEKIEDYYNDLKTTLEDLNEYLEDEISSDDLDTEITNIKEAIDDSTIKDLDEEELDDMDISDLDELVEDDYEDIDIYE